MTVRRLPMTVRRLPALLLGLARAALVGGARRAAAAARLAARSGRRVASASRPPLRAALGRWQSRPAARSRQLRRLGAVPLPSLYELHPDARRATPREVGLRSIDLDAIAGSAVGGVTQRGSDFKPLKAFRSQNWVGRFQRIRKALDELAILPPIDVVRYPPGGPYWVLDGHNRIAAALDVGQVSIDANVTELVPPGQNPSERPGDLAAALAGTRSLRAAGQGGRLQSVGDDVVIGIPESLASGPAGPPREPAGGPASAPRDPGASLASEPPSSPPPPRPDVPQGDEPAGSPPAP